jgi:hypothetical protein
VVTLLHKVADAYRTQTDHHRIEVAFPARFRQSGAMRSGCARSLRICSTTPSSTRHRAAQSASAAGCDRRSRLRTQESETDVAPPELTAREYVVIYIADQGIGIPASDLSHVFDRYYRVDSSLRRTTAGAGLGLYLAKAIVDAHGGRIWATSDPGKGTTFFVALPVDADACEGIGWTTYCQTPIG